jgi:L-threonylcarbamoyladenylate synthase
MKIIQKSNFFNFEKQLVKACREGGTIVMPFDTMYALVANPFNDQSIDQLYKIKGRDFNKPVSLAFSSASQILEYIRMSSQQELLINKSVPGDYTFILPFDVRDRKNFSNQYRKLDKIGIKITNDKFVIDFIEKVGHPIAATSANISDMPNCWSADDFLNQIRSSEAKPDYVIDGGTILETPPSEVVDISDTKQPKVLRR